MAIKITFRQTSRLSMRIGKNGDVLVSAPLNMPQSEVEDFIRSHTEWIQQAREKTKKHQEKRYAFFRQLPLQTPAQQEEALLRMQQLIDPLVAHYAPLMGVEPRSICFQATISRWGCCYPKTREISFSVYLLLLPAWCAEHVVVHELAHLIEANHSRRFYEIMDRFFPRWKEARKETRRISNLKD